MWNPSNKNLRNKLKYSIALLESMVAYILSNTNKLTFEHGHVKTENNISNRFDLPCSFFHLNNSERLPTLVKALATVSASQLSSCRSTVK